MSISSLPPSSSLFQSHWIEASAGSGKTKVLTDRILACLLEGASPQKILALTFTKAAASEMEERIMEKAIQWAHLPPSDLEKELTSFFPTPSSLHKERAQHLFDILTQSDGILFRTLHSFCHTLLAQFPMEAGLSPGFTVMNDAQAHDILQEIVDTLQTLLLEDTDFHSPIPSQQDKPKRTLTIQDLNELIPSWRVENFTSLCQTILHQAPAFTSFFDHTHRGFASPISTETLTHEALVSFFSPPGFPLSTLESWQQALTDSQGHDAPLFILNTLLTATPDKRVNSFAAYRSLFITLGGTPRKNLLSKSLQDKHPSLLSHLIREQERLQEHEETHKQLEFEALTHRFHRLAHSVVTLYTSLKRKRHLLDYNDLLEKTRILLTTAETIPWILFKLDHTIDHILLDEAQDTNLIQWDILLTLFTHLKENAPPHTPKTLFVVGDDKQSIYGFQGANPRFFRQAQEKLSLILHTHDSSLTTSSLDASWRSTPAVIHTVEAVFREDSLRKTLTSGKWRPHKVTRRDPGEVDIWPLITSDAPIPSPLSSLSAHQKLAHSITQAILDWMSCELFLPSQNRPIQFGDILILVRKRSPLIDDLITLFTHHQIPVSGKDRFILQDHLGIQDLISLGNYLTCPEDDYALACVLKGPFIELPEKLLEILCTTRESLSLHQKLAQHAAHDLSFQDAWDKLEAFKLLANQHPPSTFFANVLVRFRGREALIDRFGSDIIDFLEIFMERIYELEEKNHYSLPLTLHTFSCQATPIKRDNHTPSPNHVRIMTVHGAKGLQSPVVILADTTSVPTGPAHGDVVWHQGIPLLVPHKERCPHSLKTLLSVDQEAFMEEYQRLLYVALTRAQDKLVVAGSLSPHKKLPDLSWYKSVYNALMKTGNPHVFCHISQDVLETSSTLGYKLKDPHTSPPSLSSRSNKPTLLTSSPSSSEVPSWLLPLTSNTQEFLFPLSNPSPPPISPSQERGILLHKLLESLVKLSPETWPHHAPSLLSYVKKTTDLAHNHEEPLLLEKIYDLARTPSLSFLFSPKTRSEVSILGYLSDHPTLIRIDLLLEQEAHVWVIDHKSDINPPLESDLVPLEYKAQLALYKKVIQPLYPHKQIRTALLWIETTTLMELS